ncbi:MAG: Ni/Fe-hydrogenase cytochrome b subunit [bacterium]|jgi:Ni/Fe-hydrogenase subunit HybB-like protein/Fe-S-cluster-containing dehydrogenase component|nr:Ni/Fe-hydrogenase cytochrome b subunit [bacterium]
MDRRRFLVTLGAAGSSCLTLSNASASEQEFNPDDAYGVLVDTTYCIGCRKCEWACNNVNHLPTESLESFENKSVFEEFRRPDASHYTIINQQTDPEGRPMWVKYQCMHCNQPACWSACLVTAFTKHADGSVTYDPWKCMGCRYCMVACPFQIPAYEYDNALTPKVQKCNFCHDRLQEGDVPGCVEICPPQCLTFGKRSDLLALATQKIERDPDRYIPHIYGEEEVGGTSWLYVANKPFEELGLPKLSADAPPQTTEDIQHGIFKYFIPQIALFSVLGMVYKLTGNGDSDKDHSDPAVPKAMAHHHEEEAAPSGIRFFTPAAIVLSFLALMGGAVALYRFIFGIGAISNLNDQFPWGIWISIDVASGVALAAGGFTTSALVHLFHRGKYEALVRPALLTAMLGYTFVVLGLLVDLGRYYNVWHPMLPSMWSGHSVLFEVGMCVTFYLNVLYIEFLPVVVQRFKGHVNLPGALASFNNLSETLLGWMDKTLSKVMLLFIIAGVLLSCLHQSSLGALMLIAPHKMNPLWYTPILPLLFLISAIMVGYPMVIFESMLASKMLKRKPEMHLLEPLSRITPIILLIYLACKCSDLAIREVGGYLLDGSVHSTMFLIEMGIGVVLPMILLLIKSVRKTPVGLFIAALAIILGVALNRINVFLTAYTPVYKVEQYFPSWMEISVTVGLISALVLVYRFITIHFPVLPAEPKEDTL